MIDFCSKIQSESAQQLHVARETIETLKRRLAAKEESLSKNKQLLHEARNELESVASNHEEEMYKIQNELREKSAATKGKAFLPVCLFCFLSNIIRERSFSTITANLRNTFWAQSGQLTVGVSVLTTWQLFQF